jgi:hypothetical protein
VLYFSVPIIVLKLLFIFSFVSKVQAGAGRQQLTPTSTPETMPERPSTPLSSERNSVFNSAKPLSWESPYWLNNKICRESQGNIICLNPEEAKKLRWSIPTNNQ